MKLLITYQKWVVDVRKNSVLGDNMINLSKLDDISLLQSLHSEVLARFFVFTEHNSTETTGS